MKPVNRTLALLLVAGSLAIAQLTFAQPSSNYSWRLDSIRINHTYPEDASYTTFLDMINYFYDEDGFTEFTHQIHYRLEDQLYYRINPANYKYVYRDFGENGKHTMYLYSYLRYDQWTEELIIDTASSISDFVLDTALFSLEQRYDYAYDTYRNIYDEDGHLIRQIRNYDYIVYTLDSLGNWEPGSRIYHAETDSTLESIHYYFNTKEQQWKNRYSVFGRNKYRNHRLWMQEKVWDDDKSSVDSGTEYNENGGIIRTYKGSPQYGSATYYRSGRITGVSNWTPWNNPDRIVETTTEMYIDDVFSRKTVTSAAKDEEYILQMTPTGKKEYPMHKRSWTYNTDSVLTAYANSLFTYDADYHCLLQIDTTLQNGVWTAKRTEYDAQGKVLYTKTQEKRAAIDEWITVSETTPSYQLTTTIQWNANPINRTIVKKYNYGFYNQYQIRESWNAELQKWITNNSNCRYVQVNLGENGEPLTAIDYDGLNNNGSWNRGIVYTFRHIDDLQVYERTPISTTNGSALPEYYVNNHAYFNAAGEYLGYFYGHGSKDEGYIDIYKKDSYNRTTDKIEYGVNIDSQLKDTMHWTLYTYFPNDSTADIARKIEMDKDTAAGTWKLYKDTKFTKQYNHYSPEGILLTVDTYGWNGDELTLTQTMIHNELTYDEQGRIKERIIYQTANINNNVRGGKYTYFYRNDTDPQWYALDKYEAWVESEQQWHNHTTPTYNDYTALDDQNRVVERITYTLNSDNTVLLPSTRSVYYYAGNAEDWTTADNYKWNTVKGEWYCSSVSSNDYTQTAGFDTDGNVVSLIKQDGSCENGLVDSYEWQYSYGNSLWDEPVLSPAAFGLTEERVNNQRPNFSPVAAKRIKQLKYYNYTSRYGTYTMDYHYTPLRDGLIEDNMPVSIEPEQTSAVFTWGAVQGAESYILHVYADAAQTEEICYVVFDKYGRVISINFVRHAPARYNELEQFEYTLDGLTAGTQYWYTIVGYDAENKTMESTNGSFKTLGDSNSGSNTDLNDVQCTREQCTHEQCTKFLRNGQLYIQHGPFTYSLRGIIVPLP